MLSLMSGSKRSMVMFKLKNYHGGSQELHRKN